MKKWILTILLFCFCLLSAKFVLADNLAIKNSDVVFDHEDYEYTKNWMSRNVTTWNKVLKSLKGKENVNYLEVGLYEGRSFFWMLENILTHETARATGVDIFTDEDLEQRFYHNLKISKTALKVTIIKGRSQTELRNLALESFDVIYIDGSHRSSDVLSDAIQSWEILKIGGFLIFDDYAWKIEWPQILKPRVAIDAFLNAYKEELDVIVNDYQLIVKKKKNICADHYACTRLGDDFYSWWSKKIHLKKGGRIKLSKQEWLSLERLFRTANYDDLRPDFKETIFKNPEFKSIKEKMEERGQRAVLGRVD